MSKDQFVRRPCMKLKAVGISFLSTFILSFMFLLPGLIVQNTNLFLSEVQKELKNKNIDFSYGEIHTSILPLSIEVQDVDFSTSKAEQIFRVEKIKISKWSLMNMLSLIQGELDISELKKLNLSMKRIEVAEKLLPLSLIGIISSLGYEDVVFDFTAEYEYENKTKQLSINQLSLESPSLAKINLSVLLKDCDLTDVFENFKNAESLNYLDDIALENLKIEIKDLSLIKRYKGFISKTFSIDPMKTLAFLKTGSGGNQRDLASEGVESKIKGSLYEFLLNPDTYLVEVAPERALSYKELSIMMMLAPERLTSALNLQFEVNGKKFE